MKSIKFTNKNGDFSLDNPDRNTGLYFPLVNGAGMMSSVSPILAGDSKMGQNTFLLSPVSIENLHNEKSTRNFWCLTDKKKLWSATGASAIAEAKRFSDDAEKVRLDAGLLWHKITRTNTELGLESEVISFVPECEDVVEIMSVTIRNISKEKVTFIPVAAAPIYGRSADNIRDHRHVTTLLNRIHTTKYGVELKPTLTFDERGHKKGKHTYGIYGASGECEAPMGFYPLVGEFIGEGGSLNYPGGLATDTAPFYPEGFFDKGKEALGGIRFDKATLAAGEEKTYTVVMGIDIDPKPYLYDSEIKKLLTETTDFWKDSAGFSVTTADPNFDSWMRWVGVQPILRRICGCSFMPHHDYGRGGRGWRDLWQDCLALILSTPESVREILVNNYGGVRMDGSNATIIGKDSGEFIADRNNIVRMWMDHGVWPFFATNLYANQTGDYSIFMEQQSYFKDKFIHRGDKVDYDFVEGSDNILLTKDKAGYCGTILEHILVQHVTSYFDVGNNGHIRLRGGDWNDALDMAREKGESVAFSAMYAGNLEEIANCIEKMRKRDNLTYISIASELSWLLQEEWIYISNPTEKRNILNQYFELCAQEVKGTVVERRSEEVEKLLRKMADGIRNRIREKEWVEDNNGNRWFNSYYDNNGKRVEGVFSEGVRIMLTGQVFTILSKTAKEKEIKEISTAVDKYLYDEFRGGYRLNTDFKENFPPIGRIFGFAYGSKENGSVFSHMAVMYAYSLYSNGFAKEGYKSLKALYDQSINFGKSVIYPAIPEYFDADGLGMYNYLTGSASWYCLTLLTQVFGVRGQAGDLLIDPKLLAEQFDKNGEAKVSLTFAKRKLDVVFKNKRAKDYGEYMIKSVSIDNKVFSSKAPVFLVDRKEIERLNENEEHTIIVTLD